MLAEIQSRLFDLGAAVGNYLYIFYEILNTFMELLFWYAFMYSHSKTDFRC